MKSSDQPVTAATPIRGLLYVLFTLMAAFGIVCFFVRKAQIDRIGVGLLVAAVVGIAGIVVVWLLRRT